MSEVSEYISEHLFGTVEGKVLEPVVEQVGNVIVDAAASKLHIPVSEAGLTQDVEGKLGVSSDAAITTAIANLEKEL